MIGKHVLLSMKTVQMVKNDLINNLKFSIRITSLDCWATQISKLPIKTTSYFKLTKQTLKAVGL